MAENIVLDKSYQFALRIVKLYKYLTEEKKEFILSKKVLDSGTNIGAYITSAQEAESKSGFTHEMQLALQFTSRTEFWLKLLRDGEFFNSDWYESIDADREELKKLLTSIVKSSKGIQREN